MERDAHTIRNTPFKFRAMSSAVLVTFSLLSLSSCKEDPALTEIKRNACSGGSALWIAYDTHGAGQMAPESPGDTFYYDMGYQFFVIDTSCRFWASDRTREGKRYGHLAGLHTGVLTRKQAGDIAGRLRLHKWPSHNNEFYVIDACDVPSFYFYSADSHFGCEQGFGQPHGELGRIVNEADAIVSKLVGIGAPVATGPIRVVSVIYEHNCDPVASLPLPRNDVLWDAPEGFDPAYRAFPRCDTHQGIRDAQYLIPDPLAAELRRLRAAYRESIPDDYSAGIPVAGPDGGIIDVFLRDVTPFEDDAGDYLFQDHPPLTSVNQSAY